MPAINILSAAGTHVTGLTIGTWYTIETTGGPWNPHGIPGGGDDTYHFRVSLNGSTWSNIISTSSDPLLPGSDSYIPVWVDTRVSRDAYHVVLYFTATQSDLWIGVSDTVYGDNTGSLSYLVTAFGSYCSYGSRVKPSTPVIVQLLPELLTVIVGAVTDGWAWPVAALFLGSTLDVGSLCAAPRPAPPIISQQDILDASGFPPTPATIAALAKMWTWFRWAAWSTFCECIPGSPSPTPEPPSIVPKPPGFPDGPLVGFQCDATNLCHLVQNLVLSVAALAAQARQTSDMVTLVQRQGVPFGYIYGTVHSALSGAGQFAVADILGLAVAFTTLPGTYPPIAGDPLTYHQVGKISTGTADGWTRSWQPTHSPYLILPISGAFTLVGWTFAPGIIATITELVREF